MEYAKLFDKMKEKGLTTYKIRKQKVLSEQTLQHIREGKPIKTDMLCRLCYALECQPGDIMEYIPSPEDAPPGAKE